MSQKDDHPTKLPVAESSLLAAIVASSDDAIVSKTINGYVTSWNAAAERIFGYAAEEMIGQHITKIIPQELYDEEERIIAQLRRGERVEHYDTVRVAKDGRRVEISLTVSPLRDASGEVVGASKVARDVTDRKDAERSQRLLVEELNHRVKNTLATVQAIATLSSRRAGSLGEFVPGFVGRIQALARAHSLLARSRMEGAEIAELVREQVILGDDERIAMSGPRVMLDPQMAVHLAMVLHELATNARCYGALSVSGGRLSIDWELRAEAGRTLVLHWQERGVPHVHAPDGRGFGTTLIEQTLRGRGGRVSMRYSAGGVTAEIVLPLPEHDPPTSAPKATEVRPGPEMAPPQAPSSDLAGKRVLIVEDEPLIVLDLELTLSAIGCKIAGSAGTVDQAMRRIEEGSIDVVVLDGNLAGHPVDEIAIALTQKRIPFAFITGYGRGSLPQGFQDAVVVGKPFNDHQLVAALESLLGGEPSVHRLHHRATRPR